MKRKPFALVFAKEYKLIPHSFILRDEESKNYGPPISLDRSKPNRLYIRKPRKESRPRLLRFPQLHPQNHLPTRPICSYPLWESILAYKA